MDKKKVKSLIIFYSYEGNTRFIAQTMAKAINADILELKPKKDMKSKGFMKYVWGGRKVVFKQKPELEPFNVNLDDYDLLVFGTPVWAFTFTPALRSFFSRFSVEHKKVAVFCCHEGGMGKTVENMLSELKENTVLGTNDFFHPLFKEKEESEKKAKAWAKELISKV